MLNTIPAATLVCNFIKVMNEKTKYQDLVLKHLTSILIAMALKGFTAKMTDIEEVSDCHRTTIRRFLSNEKSWDDEPIKEYIHKTSFENIQSLSQKTGTPMFIDIDDTVNEKTKPSSQASRPIEKAEFHHSHLLGKQVWGHQVIAMMVSCGKTALNYDIHLYDKTVQSKIAYVQEIIAQLPPPATPAYVLTDSWYTNAKIIDSCAASGYHFIGAMKANRIIYPQGIRISISEFAVEYIGRNDVSLVTVNGAKYYVYRYEGKLNGISNAVVLISWPEHAFKNPKAMKAFVCTDVSLDTATIMQYYAHRWCIETFFSQAKDLQGFGKYQIRSIKGIERLWTIMSLFHLLCSTITGAEGNFGNGLRLLRRSIHDEKVTFIYQCAKNNLPLSDVLKMCA
jgi:hypothetical protein